MDLRQACETILSHLDVRAEAEALGVEFAAASPSPSGWLPCRAVGRVDRNPSAALNVGSDGLRGLYRDLGDAGGRAIGFFDLAVRIGRFPDRDSAVRHYAEKAGVGIPPASSGVPHAAPSLEGPRRLDPGRPERPGRPRRVVPSEIGHPPRRPACLRCPEVPMATEPRFGIVLLVPRGSPGRFERPRRPGALRCRAKSVKKNAHGFFLASCGEAFGSRKKLQGKDLQKQKRCGLLECSCEDVRSSLAGGGELRYSRNSRR